jgi:hypothetical protein
MERHPNGKRGRPHKFREPCRPVTVTLPESTLARLAKIDPDRGKAIVKAANAVILADADDASLPELVEAAPGLSVILVGPSRCLRRIEWLRMIEVAPLRYLLTIPPGMPVDSLELAVIDVMESEEAQDPWEQAVLQRLRQLIASLRRGSEVSKAEVLLVEKRGSAGA